MLDSSLAGLLTGLSLIVAIGAQNAYVLRQGLAREHVGLVVAICAISDVLLIAAGVAGIGRIVEQAPWAIDLVRWLGVAFLTWYGVSSLRRARRAETLHAADRATVSRRGVAVRAMALTWLNPHVYLDTVLLLGTIANHEGPAGRWWFALGAAVGRPQRLRPSRAQQRGDAVPGQEGDAEPPHHVEHPRRVLDDPADAGHAGGDQHDVGERADRDHQPDVLARQALAQHVRVLRTDGDDQGEAGEQSGGGGVEHPGNARSRPP